MMKNDYETGLQRGRGSRHNMSRIRWVLLALVVFNIFLLYKLWTQNVEISAIETKNSEMHEHIEDTNRKKLKAEKITTEIQMEKNECDTKLAEEKGLSAKYKNEKESQERVLDSSRSDLKELTASYERLKKEKETVDSEHERCLAELESTKEIVEQLQAKIQKLEQSPIGQTTPNDENKPVVKDIGTENESENKDQPPADDSEEIHDADAPGSVALVQCGFEENPEAESPLCKYHDDLSSTGKWKIGNSDIINSHLGDNSKAEASYLFIDDTTLASNIPAGIILDSFQSNQCAKLTLTTFSVESGGIKIENNGEIFELPGLLEGDAEKNWRKDTFHFKKSDEAQYNIKITGRMVSKGAFAIANLSVIEEKCKEEKTENTEEDEEITDEERKDISEIVK
ncbi:uncharacterized protein LOC120335828 [Styela clava]